MGSLVTLKYTVKSVGATPARISALLAAVPIPLGVVTALGGAITGDNTNVIGGDVIRTVHALLVPIGPAMATAAIFGGNDNSGSPIASLTLTNQGDGYVGLPDILILDQPENGVVSGFGARAGCTLNVRDVTVDNGGTLYTGTPTVTFVGGLAPGGVAATGHAVMALNSVVAVVVDTHGSGYSTPPLVVFTNQQFDSTGSGAKATANLQVDQLLLLNPGQAYRSPIVQFIPRSIAMFPLGSDQAAPWQNLMLPNIQRQLCCPITAAPATVT